MKISLIAAMSRNRVIGCQGKLPWNLPADFRRLKQITMGKPIIMGRKTYESIGKPLPGRRNIIISRQENLIIQGCEVFSSLIEALAVLSPEPEVIIFGGETLFREALPIADYLYLTLIDVVCVGDTFFPQWNETAWETVLCENHEADSVNPHAYTFLELQSKRGNCSIK